VEGYTLRARDDSSKYEQIDLLVFLVLSPSNRATLYVKEETMQRVILSLLAAGVGCLLMGTIAMASPMPTFDAFLLDSLDDIKERVHELRGEISLALLERGLTRAQRAQLKAAYRKTSTILRNVARAEARAALGQSVDTLLTIIQNQLEAIEELLSELLALLDHYLFFNETVKTSPQWIKGSLYIYDMQGRLVRFVALRSAGVTATEFWDDLPAGVYLYRFESEGQLHKVLVKN
jgi:hypothetical protein